MIRFEDDLRTRLHDAAATQAVPADYDERLARSARRHARRRVATRGAALAVAAAVVTTGVVTLQRPDERQVTVTPAASPPPAPGEAGWVAVPAGPVAPRFQHLAVAAGDVVFVWGGYSSSGGSRSDGALYDPATGEWRELPPSPLAGTGRGDAVGVWTGREVVALAGIDGAVVAAAYDPATDEWRRLADPPLPHAANAMTYAVWTGRELLVLGETQDDNERFVPYLVGYDPESDQWSERAAPPALSSFADAVWTGRELLFVGTDGNGSGSKVPANTLVSYDLAADRWERLPWSLPGSRGAMTVAWTGRELFVGGGHTYGEGADGGPSADAALFDPATRTWRQVPDAPVPFAGNDRYREVFTGRLVVTLNDGVGAPVAFDPVTGQWHAGPASPLGGDRRETPWVWDGSRVLALFGGVQSQSQEGTLECCGPIDGGEAYQLPG